MTKLVCWWYLNVGNFVFRHVFSKHTQHILQKRCRCGVPCDLIVLLAQWAQQSHKLLALLTSIICKVHFLPNYAEGLDRNQSSGLADASSQTNCAVARHAQPFVSSVSVRDSTLLGPKLRADWRTCVRRRAHATLLQDGASLSLPKRSLPRPRQPLLEVLQRLYTVQALEVSDLILRPPYRGSLHDFLGCLAAEYTARPSH